MCLVPLGIAWLFTASPEELAHYADFIGPPTPSGWRVWGHAANEQRVEGEKAAQMIREGVGFA